VRFLSDAAEKVRRKRVGKRQKGKINLVTLKNVKEVAASVFDIIISEFAFLTISNTEQIMPETDINCSESFIYDKNIIS